MHGFRVSCLLLTGCALLLTAGAAPDPSGGCAEWCNPWTTSVADCSSCGIQTASVGVPPAGADGKAPETSPALAELTAAAEPATAAAEDAGPAAVLECAAWCNPWTTQVP